MEHPILISCATDQCATNVEQNILELGFTNVQSGGSYEDLIGAGCEC